MVGNEKVPFEGLIRKLERLAKLDEEDREALASLRFSTETINEDRHLVREGDEPSDCAVLVAGHACRYKSLSSGGRQIVSFHLPGDMLDAEQLLLSRADHSIQAITDVIVAWVPTVDLKKVVRERPAIADALWRDCLIDASVFREWVLNVGQRDPRSRIAHMLCEFAARRQAAGLGPPEGAALPMSQERIADATGLTSVHVNRMLHALMTQGVIALDGRHVQIIDWNGLRTIAEFDPGYLHAVAA